jgi:hypothetical protein
LILVTAYGVITAAFLIVMLDFNSRIIRFTSNVFWVLKQNWKNRLTCEWEMDMNAIETLWCFIECYHVKKRVFFTLLSFFYIESLHRKYKNTWQVQLQRHFHTNLKKLTPDVKIWEMRKKWEKCEKREYKRYIQLLFLLIFKTVFSFIKV